MIKCFHQVISVFFISHPRMVIVHASFHALICDAGGGNGGQRSIQQHEFISVYKGTGFQNRVKDFSIHGFPAAVIHNRVLERIPCRDLRASRRDACPDFRPDGTSHTIPKGIIVPAAYRRHQSLLHIFLAESILIKVICHAVRPCFRQIRRRQSRPFFLQLLKPDQLKLQVVIGDSAFRQGGIPVHMKHFLSAEFFFQRLAQGPPCIFPQPASHDLISKTLPINVQRFPPSFLLQASVSMHGYKIRSVPDSAARQTDISL